MDDSSKLLITSPSLQAKCIQYFPLLLKFNMFFDEAISLTMRLSDWFALFFQLAKDFGLHNFLFYDYDHLNNKYLSKADEDSKFARNFLMTLMSLSVGKRISQVMHLKETDEAKSPRSFKKLIEEFPCFLGYEPECILLFFNLLNQQPFLDNTLKTVPYRDIALFLKFLTRFTFDIEYAKNNRESCSVFIQDLAFILQNSANFGINELFFRKYYTEIMPPLPSEQFYSSQTHSMLEGYDNLRTFFEAKVNDGSIRKKADNNPIDRCQTSLKSSKQILEDYFRIILNLSKNMENNNEDEVFTFFFNLEIDLAKLSGGKDKIDKFLSQTNLLKSGQKLETRCVSDGNLRIGSEYSKQLQSHPKCQETEFDLLRTFSSESYEGIDQLSKSIDISAFSNDS